MSETEPKVRKCAGTETTETEKAVVGIIGTVVLGYVGFKIVDFIFHWWIDMLFYAGMAGKMLQ